jgi:hypothetical protein
MEKEASLVSLGRKKYQEAMSLDISDFIKEQDQSKDLKKPPSSADENEKKYYAFYKQKIQLLLESAKFYLEAVKGMNNNNGNNSDETLKLSLIALANSSAYEAHKIKNILVYSKGKGILPSKTESVRKKTLEKQYSIYYDRLMIQSHINVLDEIAAIPQPKPISTQEVIKDLLALDEKIEEMGFKRPTKGKTSVVNGKNMRDVMKESSVLGQSVHLSSQLGESFMVLDDKHTSKNKASTTIINNQRKGDRRGSREIPLDLNLSVISLPHIERGNLLLNKEKDTSSKNIPGFDKNSKVGNIGLTQSFEEKPVINKNEKSPSAVNETALENPDAYVARLLKTIETLSECYSSDFSSIPLTSVL